MLPTAGGRPLAGEYPSFFAGYIGRVPDGEILTILQTQLDATCTTSPSSTRGMASEPSTLPKGATERGECHD